MLSRARITASLIRSLSLGSTGLLATAFVASTTVACKDEGQPEYWIDKLEDPAWKPRAIKRLELFYEDTIAKANKDMESAEVKALVDKIVDPLTKIYVAEYDTLDDKTRESLIKLLASFRDKRTEPALKRAFEEFAKRGRGGRDVKWATRPTAELNLESLADALFGAFDKLRAESPDGAIAYLDVTETMVKLKSKSWVGPLSSKLEPEIPAPNAAKKETFEQARNQTYWQTTAAQVLGEIGDPAAIEPLLKVLLDPSKGNVHSTALLALVKIGKPVIAPTVKLLKDEDPKLAEFALQRLKKATNSNDVPKDKPQVQMAAIILGMLGRSEGLEPLISALQNAKDDSTKALIAREVTKIVPATAASKTAFKQAYEGISGDTMLQNANALMVLTETAGTFFDPSLVDWLLERAEKIEGNADVKKGIQGIITLTAIKLMKADQLAAVQGAVGKYGTQIEKDAFKSASDMLKACGEKAACYLAELEKRENLDMKNQFRGIKAAYMLGTYGNEQTRDEITKRLESIDNAAVRFIATQVIDRLSPQGSPATAEALQKIIAKNVKSADKERMQGDGPLKEVMYRLRSRAN